jgi:ankyrin repeat protein
MITAAEEGVEDVVELLLERGANIEASDNVSICTTLDSAVLYYTKLYCTTLHYTL